MSLHRQLIGADNWQDRHRSPATFFSGCRCSLVELRLLAMAYSPRKCFHRIDTDVVFHFIAVTAGLAGCRTHSPHHRRERVGLGQTTPCIFLPRHGRLAVRTDRRFFRAAHDGQITANILTCRTTSLARRSGLDVGRTFVRIACLKYLLVQARHFVVAIFVTTERNLLRVSVVADISSYLSELFLIAQNDRVADQLMHAANHSSIESVNRHDLGKLRLADRADGRHEIDACSSTTCCKHFHTRQGSLDAQVQQVVVSRPPPPPQQKVCSRVVLGDISTKLLATALMMSRGISNCPPQNHPCANRAPRCKNRGR